VDRAHFAMDPTMVDSNLAYVAGSRHRESFALHCTQDDYASLEKLLGRNREKDTSVDYLPEVLTDAQKYVDLNQQRIAMQIEDLKLMLALKDVMREKTRLAIEVEQRKHEKENSYSI
jgi:ATP-dependent exoDNAse (exonuclease V) alpha subunit